MTMRVSDEDAVLIRRYAQFENKSISDFIRDAVLGSIEDEEDLSSLREAIAADDGARYTQKQVLSELGF